MSPRPRKPENRALPPRMKARQMKSGKVHYYYRTTDGGAIPLGTDLAEAKLKWAELERSGTLGAADAVEKVAERFRLHHISQKSLKTRREYESALSRLLEAFKGATLRQIRPVHVRQYLDRRSAKIAGNREVAVLSAMFNWARSVGITDQPNPCAGVKKHPEGHRDVYVSDTNFDTLWQHACPELRDALDLARITGQRPADILKMRRTDIEDGHLWVKQGKTGAKVGIVIEGELESVIARCLTRERAATGPYLIQTGTGQKLTYAMLRKRFDAARDASGEKWQFRDLRAKTATDMTDLREAQELLGHAEETTTNRYRRSRGVRVKPGGRR